MVFNFQLLALFIGILWLFILTVLFWQMSSHYNKLTKNITNKSLKSVLEEMFKNIDLNKKDIAKLIIRCDRIEKDGLMHIQKIGLLRFNPFKETGGNQSFILSLTDANENGIVISGLYSRSGTRWYAKKVVEGKGIEHELSDEEKKTLKEAGKI